MLSLEQAVRKLSGQAADAFGLMDHGYLKEGKRANVVLFDPATVKDTATHVLVGGQVVVRDGVLTGNRPGKVVRRGG